MDVTDYLRRDRRYDLFADLPGVPAVVRFVDAGSGRVTVSFDGALSPELVVAVRDRMTSRDDADQADRAMLRAAAAAGAINLAEMHLAYTLGDPIPAPVLPQM